MTHPRRVVTDELLKQTLEARASRPDNLLASEIVQRVAALPQRRPWFVGPFAGRPRPAMVLAMTILLLATLIAVAAIGERLLERPGLSSELDNGPIVAVDFDGCRFIRVDPTVGSLPPAEPEPWNCPPGVASNDSLAHDAAWSRDGGVLGWTAHWLCFSCLTEPDQTVVAMSGVWIRDGEAPSQQIVHCGTDYCPRLDVAPDGQRVTFTRGVLGAAEGTLVVADVAGNVIQSVTVQGDLLHSGPRYSPDGSRVAFTVTDGNASRLMIVDANGQGLMTVYEDAGHLLSQPSWSADGEHIALISRDERGETVVVVFDVDEQTARPMGPGPAVFSTGESWGVDWPPDGSRLLLTRQGSNDADGSAVQLVGIDMDDGRRTTLYSGGCCVTGAFASYSPDGDWIALAAGSLYLMRNDGSDFHRISDLPAALAWQPLPSNTTTPAPGSDDGTPGSADIWSFVRVLP
jgi:dipeptidyl aminopeptidase/acylaminoacyl peptidase